MKRYLLFFITMIMMGGCHVDSSKGTIVFFGDPGELEILASKEVKRYIYQRCNTLFDLIESDNAMLASIIISSKENLPDGYVDEELSERSGNYRSRNILLQRLMVLDRRERF